MGRRLHNLASQILATFALAFLALAMMQAVACADGDPGGGDGDTSKCSLNLGRCKNISCPPGKGCATPDDCSCLDNPPPG